MLPISTTDLLQRLFKILKYKKSLIKSSERSYSISCMRSIKMARVSSFLETTEMFSEIRYCIREC